MSEMDALKAQAEETRARCEALAEETRDLFRRCEDLPRLRAQGAATEGLVHMVDRDIAEIRQAQMAYTGSLNALHANQSAQNRHLRQMAEAIGTFSTGQAALITKHERLTDRVDHLTGRVADLTEGQTALVGRFDQLTGRVDHLADRVDQLAEGQSTLIGRFDQLTDTVTDLTAAVHRLVDGRT